MEGEGLEASFCMVFEIYKIARVSRNVLYTDRLSGEEVEE